MGRASSLLASPPPVVGANGFGVAVIAYKDAGPQRLTGTVATLSDSANLNAVGEDLVILLPGRGVNLNTSPPTYGKASDFTAGAGIYTNTQATPLRRAHGMQFHAPGRHVVSVGGQIDMDVDHATGSPLPPGSTLGFAKQNRSMYGLDWTGTCHIEGVLHTGGFQFETANWHPSATGGLVIQNRKIARSTGFDGTAASCRYYPYTANGTLSGHDGGDGGDQFETVPRFYILDGHHSETNWFQEMFLRAEPGQIRPDLIWIDNVASWDYQGPGGWLYINPDANGAYCPDMRIGSNVSMQPGLQRYPVSDGVTGQRAYTTSLTNNCYPQTGQVTGTDGNGAYLTHAIYKTLAGAAGGKVYTIPVGTAIDETRALSISGVGAGPGANYVSPGYAVSKARVARIEMTTPAPPASRARVSRIEMVSAGGSMVRVARVELVSSQPRGAVVTSTGGTVRSGYRVTLDGSKSTGVLTAYEWSQVSGPTVIIADPTAAVTSFVTPAALSPSTVVLSFRVQDAGGWSNPVTLTYQVQGHTHFRAIGGVWVPTIKYRVSA